MKKSKLLLSLALSLAIAFNFTGFVLADEAAEGDGSVLTITETETYTADSDYDNDELAEMYIAQEMDLSDPVCYAKYNYVSTLSSADALVFSYLRGQISQIASGSITSTEIALPAQYSYTYSAADLGMSNLTQNTTLMKQRVAEKLPINVKNINQALMGSCPYDMYWYDKEEGLTVSTNYSYNSSSVTVSFTYCFSVEKEYQYSNDEYKVNPTYGQAAKAAAANAKIVIDYYATLDDYNKLLAYNNAIRNLTDYNDAAAESATMPYGNPWQMVWVFDGDPNTEVVCEGYAKAFQYLCDNSTFQDSSVYAISVSGKVTFSSNNSGGHMWNIVHIGGANYLVDVTSNDSVGSNIFFLVGATGSVSSGYVLYDGSYYPYDTKIKSLYPASALTLAGSNYSPSSSTTPSNPSTPSIPSSSGTPAVSGTGPQLTGGLAHVQDYGDVGVTADPLTGMLTIGTTGMGKRLEAITIDFANNTPYEGTLMYRVHVQDIGWMDWVEAGSPAGTSGLSKRIEAIEIKLTGDLANYYSVVYSVHIQDYGDAQGWVHDGALAGTTGESKRIEQLKIKIVPTGSDTTMSVKYRVHVQDYGWEGAYASNGGMSGTSGQSQRLEGIEIFLEGCQYSGGIQYKTHVQDYGWESSWSKDGEMSGTQGQSKRLEGISIELYGEVANYYDVYYRVHAQDIGWLSWAKNGDYSGTAGRSARLEAIQIVLVPKGSPAPDATYAGITSVTTLAFVEGF
ncbi:MAG: hypothetical protein J5776_00250 [Clostridiales bacterium]|nr:hypothetical protein [Clostridiales bacterium]